MKDSEIDVAVRECVDKWLSLRLYDAATHDALKHYVSALVRRVRDAEQERCAVIMDELSSKVYDHAKGPYLKGAAAIRAPRTEEKR